jgi:hypothetical protein
MGKVLVPSRASFPPPAEGGRVGVVGNAGRRWLVVGRLRERDARATVESFDNRPSAP